MGNFKHLVCYRFYRMEIQTGLQFALISSISECSTTHSIFCRSISHVGYYINMLFRSVNWSCSESCFKSCYRSLEMNQLYNKGDYKGDRSTIS